MRARTGQPLPILAGLVLAVVLWATFTAPTAAHARLASSDPAIGDALAAMPPVVRLTFTEDVAPASVRVSTTAPPLTESTPTVGAVSVEGAMVTVPIAGGAAATGTVTLAWRVVSAADGHETTGLLIFSVGTGIPPVIDAAGSSDATPWTSVALRAGGLLGLALQAAGLASGWLTGTTPRRRPAVAGAAMGLIGFAADAVHRDLLGRASGRLLVLAAVLGIAVAITAPVWRGASAAVLWLAAVTAVVAGGHAAGEGDRLLATAVGATHTALGLAWAGAILAVCASAYAGDPGPAMRRLGPVAIAGVAGLAAAGIALTALRVDSLRSLTGLTYGRLVLAKQGLLVTAVAAASINRLAILPRLPDPRWARIARPVLAIEAAILVGAVVVAGALSSSPPAERPRPVPVATRAIPVDLRAPAGDLDVEVAASILGTADDRLRFTVIGHDGQPVLDVQRLIVASSVVRRGETALSAVARVDATPDPTAPGVFALPATTLAVTGLWTLDVTVRRAGLEDRVAALSLDTTGWTFQPPRLVEDAWRRPTLPPAVVVLLATAAIVLAVGFAGVRRSETIEPLPALIILSAVVAITAGFGLQALQRVTPTTAGHGLDEPGGALDLTRAADDYRTYCLACHGAGGGGVDNPDPLHDHGSGASLVDRDTQRLDNGNLYWQIGAGVSGTTMPAYDVALTADERWALVAYLRTLQRDASLRTTTPETGEAN